MNRECKGTLVPARLAKGEGGPMENQTIPELWEWAEYYCPWCYVAAVRLHKIRPEYEGRVRLWTRAFPLEVYGGGPPDRHELELEIPLAALQEPEPAWTSRRVDRTRRRRGSPGTPSAATARRPGAGPRRRSLRDTRRCHTSPQPAPDSRGARSCTPADSDRRRASEWNGT